MPPSFPQYNKTIIENKNPNRFLVIFGIFLFVLILSLAIWFIFFKKENNPIVNQPVNNLPVVGTDRNNSYTDNSSSTNNNTGFEDESDFRVIWNIWDKPVAGYGFFYNASSTHSNILFVDKATGNIYKSIYNELTDLYDNIKVTNTTFKNVSSANFTSLGDYVIINYKNSKNINESFVAKIPRTENTDKLSGVILGQNIKSITNSPNESKFIYIKENQNGSSVNLYDTIKEKETILANFPISQFNITWKKDNSIILSTKATSYTTQQNFSLNINTGKINDFVTNDGSINISPNNNGYLVSNGLNIKYIDNPYGNEQNFNTQTVSDKCVWVKLSILCASDNSSFGQFVFPDDWYKGYISFSDSFNLLDVTNNKETTISSLKDISGQLIDVYKPSVSRDNSLLLFNNKKDYTLWAYDLVNTLSI